MQADRERQRETARNAFEETETMKGKPAKPERPGGTEMKTAFDGSGQGSWSGTFKSQDRGVEWTTNRQRWN